MITSGSSISIAASKKIMLCLQNNTKSETSLWYPSGYGNLLYTVYSAVHLIDTYVVRLPHCAPKHRLGLTEPSWVHPQYVLSITALFVWAGLQGTERFEKKIRTDRTKLLLLQMNSSMNAFQSVVKVNRCSHWLSKINPIVSVKP